MKCTTFFKKIHKKLFRFVFVEFLKIPIMIWIAFTTQEEEGLYWNVLVTRYLFFFFFFFFFFFDILTLFFTFAFSHLFNFLSTFFLFFFVF